MNKPSPFAAAADKCPGSYRSPPFTAGIACASSPRNTQKTLNGTHFINFFNSTHLLIYLLLWAHVVIANEVPTEAERVNIEYHTVFDNYMGVLFRELGVESCMLWVYQVVRESPRTGLIYRYLPNHYVTCIPSNWRHNWILGLFLHYLYRD